MATRRDYLEKLNAERSELHFLDLTLQGWHQWASEGRPGPRPPAEAGKLLGIAVETEGRYNLQLPADYYVFVETRIKVLPPRYGEIVDLEYLGVWRRRRYLLSQEEKWSRLNLKRTAYGNQLDAALNMLYGLLMPSIDEWKSRLYDKPEVARL